MNAPLEENITFTTRSPGVASVKSEKQEDKTIGMRTINDAKLNELMADPMSMEDLMVHPIAKEKDQASSKDSYEVKGDAQSSIPSISDETELASLSGIVQLRHRVA